AATMYMNWRGRTVTEIRQENALRLDLEDHIQKNEKVFGKMTPKQVHEALREFVTAEVYRGRLKLDRPKRTPFGWWLRNFIHLIGWPIIPLSLTPFLLLYLPVFIYQLRRRETTDRQYAPPVSPCYEAELGNLEDYDVTNQFTVVGGIKPGLFRRWLMSY